MTLVVPLAVALMVGAVDFGMGFSAQATLGKSVRDAARYVAGLPAGACSNSHVLGEFVCEEPSYECTTVRESQRNLLCPCPPFLLVPIASLRLQRFPITQLFLQGPCRDTSRHFQTHSTCPLSIRRFKLVGRKLLRDITGSILVEYTIVFPLFILLVLGTVDVAYMLSEWALANKAAYVGARTAVVADAVANGITNVTFDQTKTGQLCFDPSTGASTGDCPTITATSCTGTLGGVSCTGGTTLPLP